MLILLFVSLVLLVIGLCLPAEYEVLGGACIFIALVLAIILISQVPANLPEIHA